METLGQRRSPDNRSRARNWKETKHQSIRVRWDQFWRATLWNTRQSLKMGLTNTHISNIEHLHLLESSIRQHWPGVSMSGSQPRLHNRHTQHLGVCSDAQDPLQPMESQLPGETQALCMYKLQEMLLCSLD